jgi:putative peptidoglycan lipid II flippase
MLKYFVCIIFNLISTRYHYLPLLQRIMNQVHYRKIALATLIMTISVFLSRVLGVLRESVLAAVGGASTAMDAYKTAFILPEILNHVLASGFLSITFIPIYSSYLARNDEAGGWRIFSVILTAFGMLLAVLIAMAMGFAPQLLPLLVPGKEDPVFFSQTINMTRIVLPAQLFFFAGGLLMAVQFAKKQFLFPALSPLIYNLGIILGGLLLGPRLGIQGFAWGALAGAFIGSFVLQLVGAFRAGLRFLWCFELNHPDLRRYCLLTLPLMVGLTMTFSTEVFSKFFGSFLPPGGISWIDFAWRVILALVGNFGQAVGMASYPFLASLAAEKRIQEMNQVLNGVLRYLVLVIPLSFLIAILRKEIIRILYERGNFGADDTLMTSVALCGMLVGAVAITAQTVVNRGYYATQNTLVPTLLGSLCVVGCLPVYWIGLKTMGVLGIGLAMSASAVVQVLVLYSAWNRRSANTGSRQVYGFCLKVTLVSLPQSLALFLLHEYLAVRFDFSSFLGSIFSILLFGALFLISSAFSVWLFKIEEGRLMWAKVMGRFFRKNHL